MSHSKIAGTVAGLVAGILIAYLYLTDLIERTALPTGSRIATLLVGALLGAGIGAYVGTDDRRIR